MDAKTLKALKGSIDKWENIVSGKGEDEGIDNCPLCKMFKEMEDCTECPVSINTGKAECCKSPYVEWELHQCRQHSAVAESKVYCKTCKKLAQKELDFLKSLLSKKVKK
jgi:hypothetical protein